MKKIFNKKFFLLLFDILILPGIFVCKYLSKFMLDAIDSECICTYFHGKCLTCGGTHFVNNLTQGKIFDAFTDNVFLFFLLIFFIITFILIHLYWLFNLNFAKKVLKKMYSIPSLIFWCVFGLIFLIIRNIPAVIFIVKLIIYLNANNTV